MEPWLVSSHVALSFVILLFFTLYALLLLMRLLPKKQFVEWTKRTSHCKSVMSTVEENQSCAS